MLDQQDPFLFFSHMGAWAELHPASSQAPASNDPDVTEQQTQHRVHETKSNCTPLPTRHRPQHQYWHRNHNTSRNRQRGKPTRPNQRSASQKQRFGKKPNNPALLGPQVRHLSSLRRGCKRPAPRGFQDAAVTEANGDKKRPSCIRENLGIKSGNVEHMFWKLEGPAAGALLAPFVARLELLLLTTEQDILRRVAAVYTATASTAHL